MPKFPRAEAGFTLLEVLVVIAILAMTSLFLNQTYVRYLRLYTLENAKTDLNIANQFTLGDLSNNLKEASAVLATSTLDGLDLASDPQTLILSLPSLNSQGQIITGSADQVIYYLATSSPRYLIKRVRPAAASRRLPQNKRLNSDVSFLNFDYGSLVPAEAKAVVATLATSRLIYGHSLSSTSSLRAVLRNKL